jgi:hypothetical protein
MKRLALAIALMALGFSAASPARADFAVVRFDSGYCRVWTDTAAVRKTATICGSHIIGAGTTGITASTLGRGPTWPCIGRSGGIVATTGSNNSLTWTTMKAKAVALPPPE